MGKTKCLEESFTVTSPIGDVNINCCRLGLHCVKQCDKDDSTFLPDNSREVYLTNESSSQNITAYPPAQECVTWLQHYFVNRVANPNIPPVCPLVLKEDTFCGQAWKLLPRAAPFGSTITYKDLASLCGNPKACRAAGHAMSSNPISYLIPCHRVVTTNNGIGNYSQGRKNNIKKWLLDFEQSPDNQIK